MLYHGETCIVDTGIKTSFTFLTFLLNTRFGVLQQSPVSCQTVIPSSIHEKHQITTKSLYEAALDEVENTFLYTFFSFIFNYIIETEMPNSSNECMQAQHYVDYKIKDKIFTNSKIYSEKVISTALTKENIKSAEVIFNYKFEYFDTSDGGQEKVDMGIFIQEFSDIQITNNKE